MNVIESRPTIRQRVLGITPGGELDALTAPRRRDDEERLIEKDRLAQLAEKAALFREAAEQQRAIAAIDPLMAETYEWWDQEGSAASTATSEDAGGNTPLDRAALGPCGTIWDIPFTDPPPLLLDPWLHPEGVTMLYAPGGTGKGLTMAWLALRAVREAQRRPYVLDYEYHPGEWRKRLTFLGATEEEQRAMTYRAPYSGKEAYWAPEAPVGPLGAVADHVRDEVASTRSDLLLIDSYTTASSGDAAMGGEAGAREFFLAISKIGIPALVSAHVPKSAEKHPRYPFGSVFVHNLCRRSWSAEVVAEDDDPDPFVTRVHLQFRHQKRSDTKGSPDQYLTFSIMEVLKRIEVSEDTDRGVTWANRIWNVLAQPMTVKTIRETLIDDGEEGVPDEATIRKELRRQEAKFAQDKSARPSKWSRRP